MRMDQPSEIQVLRVLCLGTPQGSVKEIGVSLLRDYNWRNAAHKAFWDALCAVPSENPDVLRQLLPSQLTRLGFPDVEWEELFVPHALSKEKAIDLMLRMKSGA
jgi:hypothetical protein